MMYAWKSLLAGALALMLSAGPVMAYNTTMIADPEQLSRDPTPGEMFVDATVARPLSLVALGLGAVAFVISLPFTLPSHSADQAAKALVGAPTKHTFKRPLGRFISCDEQPDFCK